MPRTETLSVNPALIRWARESAGLHPAQAAKKIGVKADKFAVWESVKATPTARQLERIADAFKRPMASFFLSAPPDEPPLPVDFRISSALQPEALTSPTLFALRRARRLQALFGELSDEMGEPQHGSGVFADLREAPEAAAARAREIVAVDLQEQFSWKDGNKALRQWRNAVEATGSLVFQFSMPLTEIRGFSLPGEPRVVVLNTRDVAVARIFTLFHEWAHLLLGKPGLCIPDESFSVARSTNAEVYCNAFSANFLVPGKALLESRPLEDYQKGNLRARDLLEITAATFSVSRYVSLFRLAAAEIISASERRDLLAVLRANSKAQTAKRKPRGGPSPAVRAVSELGNRYIGRVLTALERGVLGYGDLPDYLPVRLKHLSRIEALISRAT